jgi:hypothetical protein
LAPQNPVEIELSIELGVNHSSKWSANSPQKPFLSKSHHPRIEKLPVALTKLKLLSPES